MITLYRWNISDNTGPINWKDVSSLVLHSYLVTSDNNTTSTHFLFIFTSDHFVFQSFTPHQRVNQMTQIQIFLFMNDNNTNEDVDNKKSLGARSDFETRKIQVEYIIHSNHSNDLPFHFTQITFFLQKTYT